MKRGDPVPLKAAPDASPELAEALKALRDDQVDQARLAQVADKLKPLLDSPPAASGVTQWLGHALVKPLTAKLAVAGLAVVTAAVWLPHLDRNGARAPGAEPHPQHEVETGRSAASQRPRAAAAHRVPPAEREPVAIPSANAVPETQPVPAPTVEAPEALRSLPTTAGRRPSPRDNRRHPKPATPAVRERSHVVEPRSRATGDARAEASDVSQAEAETLPDVPAAQPAPAPPPAPSEVALLLGARKQLATDPAATLHLLDAHATRFPRGMLTPEREVLAIQALRKLGRDEAAEQRLSRFRTRYPHSAHLRP